MFRLLCSCAVVALVLATFAGVDARATDGVVEQIFAANTGTGTPQVPGAAEDESQKEAEEASKSETEEPKEKAAKAVETNDDKSVAAKVADAQALSHAHKVLPKLLQELIDLDKRLVVDLFDLTKIPRSDAANAITEAGLRVGKITYGYDDDVPAGYVISQHPKQGQVEANSEVNLVIAQTEIAIEPFRLTSDVGTGSVSWGQMIVHRPFPMVVPTAAGPAGNSYGETKRQIPMFSIFCDGIDGNVAGNDYDRMQRRAQSIAERLLTAWNLMDQGSTLEVVAEDDLSKWEVRGPYRPSYGQGTNSSTRITAQEQVHIDAVPKGRAGHPLRIMTVYPADASRYGSPTEIDEDGNRRRRFNPMTPREAAQYFVAVIEAHHLLFSKMSEGKQDYRDLEFAKSEAGTIFELLKDDIVKVQEESLSRDSLRRALFRLKLRVQQFEKMARRAPEDWRIRDQGW